MTFHVYDNQYCKVLIITCCNMQSEDGTSQSLFWENLIVVMAENSVLDVNIKGFMANSFQVN